MARRAADHERGAVVRVLVAEDDRTLREIVQKGLTEAGFVVDVAADGAVAKVLLLHNDYDVAVLDWRMPALSGLEVLEEARREGVTTPILILSARDTAPDRVTGLDAGADDYLVKPFEFSELIARVRALQRRPPLRHPDLLECEDLRFDPVTREVRRAGAVVALTSTETLLIELLLRRSPGAVTRAAIASHVWEVQSDAVSSNTIEVHVARLRAKLAGSQARIETVRGIGYRVVGP